MQLLSLMLKIKNLFSNLVKMYQNVAFLAKNFKIIWKGCRTP